MCKKVTLVLIFILILLQIPVFAADSLSVTRNGADITIEGTFDSCAADENVSFIAVNQGATLESIKDKQGEITEEVAYIDQFKLDDNKSFTVDVPFNDKFVYGTCKIYVGARSLENIYLYEIDILKLTITKEGNGTVSEIGEKRLLQGETFTLTATPIDGERIDYIKYKGSPVVSDSSTEETYTTPPLKEDAHINVVFGIIYFALPNEITVPMTAYTPIVQEEHLDIEGNPIFGPFGISFARAENRYGEYQRVEYGILFSKKEIEEEQFIIGGKDVVKYVGKSEPNLIGQYGIKLYGAGIKGGNTYFTRAYSIYKKGNEEKTVYGDKINSFTPALAE